MRNFSVTLLVILGLVFLGGCGGGIFSEPKFEDLNGSYRLTSGNGDAVGAGVNNKYEMELISGFINISVGPVTDNTQASCQISANTMWRAKHLSSGTSFSVTLGDPATQSITARRVGDNFSFVVSGDRVEMSSNGSGKITGTTVLSGDTCAYSVTFKSSK